MHTDLLRRLKHGWLTRAATLTLLIGTLAFAAPARSDSLLYWDFENSTSVGDPIISSAVGTPGVVGVTGFASQTGGSWFGAEDFGAGVGLVHITREFGTHYPYIQFTLTERTFISDVSFGHQHNHNSGFPTYPNYRAQLQIDKGDGGGYQDIGDSLLLEGSNIYDPSDTIELDIMLNPGTYKIRWMPRSLAFGTDTDSSTSR